MKLLRGDVVRLQEGCDHVSIVTDLPNALWPFDTPLCISFQCARGTAEKYLAQHFPSLPVTVVDTTTRLTGATTR